MHFQQSHREQCTCAVPNHHGLGVRPERVDAVWYPFALVAGVRVRPVGTDALVTPLPELLVDPRVPVAPASVVAKATGLMYQLLFMMSAAQPPFPGAMMNLNFIWLM